MFSKWRERLRHTLALRVALWYAIVFVASSLALTVLIYLLVSASLQRYDREIVRNALVQYATAYELGGVNGLYSEIQRTTCRSSSRRRRAASSRGARCRRATAETSSKSRRSGFATARCSSWA
jgi:hypothetical protein